jgi:multidrug efflux pump subunit AcrA (membrane-fusion protein)
MSEKNKNKTEETQAPVLTAEEKVKINIEKKKKAAKRKKNITRLVILAVIIAAAYIFQTKSSSGYYPWQDAEAIEASKVVAPEEITVQSLIYSTTVDISGELDPLDTQEVYSKSDATVTGVFVEEGDYVKAGDLLATMDDTDEQYEIAELEAEIKESKIKGTSSELALLEMKLVSYQSALADTKLYAPIDGIVTSVDVDVDDYAETQDSCFTIIDPSKLVAEVEIDEIDLRYIDSDSIATFTFDSVPGVTSEAYISYMPYAGYLSNEGIGVKLVDFTIDNPPEGVYPGYSFEGTIKGQTDEAILIVETDAVKTDSDGYSYVMKKNDSGEPEKTIVTTDYLTEGYVEIMTGDVSEGDVLLVFPTVSSSDDDDDSSSSFNLLSTGGGPGQGPGNNGNAPRRD